MIHRFWSGDRPADEAWTRRAIETSHPRAVVMEWDVESLPLRCPVPRTSDRRHLSNVVRYWLLHEYGGLWLDHDVIPLADLRRQDPYTASLGGQREGSVLFFPEPRHPMLSALLGAVTDTGDSVYRSGAKLLHRIGQGFPDVGLEERVLPHGADGSLRHLDGPPLAVHLWSTSQSRLGPCPSSSRPSSTSRRPSTGL